MDSDLIRIASGPLSAAGGDAISDILGGIAIGDISLAGLVTLFVILIMTGRLVPKNTVDRESSLLLSQLEEARESGAVARSAAMELIKAAGIDAESIRELSNNAQLNAQLVEFIKSLADERGGS